MLTRWPSGPYRSNLSLHVGERVRRRSLLPALGLLDLVDERLDVGLGPGRPGVPGNAGRSRPPRAADLALSAGLSRPALLAPTAGAALDVHLLGDLALRLNEGLLLQKGQELTMS